MSAMHHLRLCGEHLSSWRAGPTPHDHFGIRLDGTAGGRSPCRQHRGKKDFWVKYSSSHSRICLSDRTCHKLWRGQISNPTWGCSGPGQILTMQGTQCRGHDAAWLRPNYEWWIAVPTCICPLASRSLQPVAWYRLHHFSVVAGCTAQSCTRFSDQNVWLTSRSSGNHRSYNVKLQLGQSVR